jgi:rhomboid family protein
MLPLSDGMRPRRFPVVTVALIAANLAVWILYELPDLDAAVREASFYACDVENTCDSPQPWPISWFTAMFLHASWDHILGNMLFLAVFGKSVEDAFGRLGFLVLYIAGGLAATVTQAAITLLASPEADARIPMLGASGAVSAVLGAFLVLYPHAQIKTLVLVFIPRIPARIFLGVWFLYQFFEARYALLNPEEGGSGVAFAAHVGGFLFALASAGRIRTQETPRSALSPF